MKEFLPISGGILLGVSVALIHKANLVYAFGLACLMGIAAAAINGELEISPLFILVDIGQVVVATLIAYQVVAIAKRSRE